MRPGGFSGTAPHAGLGPVSSRGRRQPRVEADGTIHNLEIGRCGDLVERGGGETAAAAKLLRERAGSVVGGQGCVERRQVSAPEPLIAALLGDQAVAIPVAGEHRLACEEPAYVGVVHALTFVRTLGHDREQNPQGRACVFNLPILEVLAGDALLRLGDVVHAVREGVEILGLGTKEILAKEAVRVVEHTAEE